jgi:hypothetical protein
MDSQERWAIFRVFVNLQEGTPLGSHNLYPVFFQTKPHHPRHSEMLKKQPLAVSFGQEPEGRKLKFQGLQGIGLVVIELVMMMMMTMMMMTLLLITIVTIIVCFF